MAQLSEFVVNHWILVTAFCAVAGLLVASFLNAIGGLNPQAAVLLINKEDALVVDVRDAAAFKKGHITGAVNIPMPELDNAKSKLGDKPDRAVLVCCESGSSSGSAVRRLQQSGLKNVKNLAGGISAWRAANLPLAND